MKPKIKRTLREIGLILFLGIGLATTGMIVSSPFWWDLTNAHIIRIWLGAILACIVMFAAASVHSEYRLVVRVERRVK